MSAAMPEACECWPTEEKYHFNYYGAIEPGSAWEYNPECPVHGREQETNMSERTDHPAYAGHYLEHSDTRASEEWPVQTGEHKADVIARAQVHATLALVEQQRIQNLIALEALQKPAFHSSYLMHNAQTNIDAHNAMYRLRPDIAAALGLEGATP